MGSHYSLWVTDPNDLEIGSSNASYLHTHIHTGAAKGEVHKRHGTCLASEGSAAPVMALSGGRTSEQETFSRCAHTAPAYAYPCIRLAAAPFSAPLGLATSRFGTQSMIVLRLE